MQDIELFDLTPVPARVLTVTELNRSVRTLLEQALPLAWVAGEISGLTVAASGHCYFSLKDRQSQVRCVMFRGRTAALGFRPQEGMQVEVRATPGLYEARGEFQLNVEFMRRAGLGALFEQFERLKAGLAAEGMFASERKRTLPVFPQRIGVVTSPAAAALRDVLTTLRRRMPAIDVVLYPTLVQGEGAALQIAQAIRRAGERAEVDVLIVCRGGGCIEDLWAFNEEVVARAIAGCPLPVISGIGHETDVTIADFVADRRAATPTAAAELAAPNRIEWLARLQQLLRQLTRDVTRVLAASCQRLDYAARRLVHPGQRLDRQKLRLDSLEARLMRAWGRRLELAQWRLDGVVQRLGATRPDLVAAQVDQARMAGRLQAGMQGSLQLAGLRVQHLAAQLAQLNPEAVLLRGYSVVALDDGTIVRDAAQVSPQQRLQVKLAKGRLMVEVSKVEPDSDSPAP